MKGLQIIFRPDGSTDVEHLDAPPSLPQLQAAVGGHIQAVPDLVLVPIAIDAVVSCLAYCNEHGKIEELPINEWATSAWNASLKLLKDEDGIQLYPNGLTTPSGELVDVLMGDVVVIIGDEAFMKEHVVGPEDEDIPSHWWHWGKFIPMP